MSEQLKTCTGCETCWLATRFATIGASYDNGVLTPSEASDKVSQVSREANRRGCPSPQIGAGRKSLTRVNPNLNLYREITHFPVAVIDVYEIGRRIDVQESRQEMKRFKRGRRTLGSG